MQKWDKENDIAIISNLNITLWISCSSYPCYWALLNQFERILGHYEMIYFMMIIHIYLAFPFGSFKAQTSPFLRPFSTFLRSPCLGHFCINFRPVLGPIWALFLVELSSIWPKYFQWHLCGKNLGLFWVNLEEIIVLSLYGF